jgi:hypothetical protein
LFHETYLFWSDLRITNSVNGWMYMSTINLVQSSRKVGVKMARLMEPCLSELIDRFCDTPINSVHFDRFIFHVSIFMSYALLQ